MSQTWNAEIYAQNARFVSELGASVLDLLNPQAGERILDLGCGDGALTAKLLEFGCDVVGVDASPEFVQAAQQLGLDARLMDGQNLTFDREFDAVFSNAALHWMKEPDRVISGVWQSLKPGGRFVGEFGGDGNVATIRMALHEAIGQRGIDPQAIDPWYFPTVAEYQERLITGGFRVDLIELIPRPTPLPTAVSGWLTTFANPFVSAIDPRERADLIAEVIARVEPHLCDENGQWTADYVRLRFMATKTSESIVSF
jgi:trans-aconitate methyltransferase